MAAPTVPSHPLPVEVPQLTELDEALADLRHLRVAVLDVPTPEYPDQCGTCRQDEAEHPIRDAVAQVCYQPRSALYVYRSPVCAGDLVDETRYQVRHNGPGETWVERFSVARAVDGVI